MPFNNNEFENLIVAIQNENSDSNFIENRGADSSISDDARATYHFQDTPISTEIDLSYMRPLKRQKVQEKFNTFRHRDELSTVSYDDAIVLSGNNRKGGVIDCNGQLVEESRSSWFGGAYDVEDDQTIEYGERTVVFLGEYATGTWGHAHVSLLVRFWYCLLQKRYHLRTS